MLKVEWIRFYWHLQYVHHRLMTTRSISLWWREYRDQFLREWSKGAGKTKLNTFNYTQTQNIILTKLCFFLKKAEIFPPWASRLERVLQGWTLCESQVQTIKGELQTFKHELSTLADLNNTLMLIYVFSEVFVVIRDRASPVFWSFGEDAGVWALQSYLSFICSVPPLFPAPRSSKKESSLKEQLWYEQMTLDSQD